MGLAVERLPLTLHWKKLYISGRSNDNDNLLGIDYGGSHIVALQRSSERRKTKQGEERHQPFPLLTMKENHRLTAAICFLIHWLKSFWSMPISFLRKAKKSSTVGFVLNARFNAS